MDFDDARQDIEQFVSSWFNGRIPTEARKAVIINADGFNNAAKSAQSHSLALHDALQDSDGIDEHKEAAALAFAVAQTFPYFVRFADTKSRYTLDSYKENCRADCALSVFLSMLEVDRSNIEAEPNTIGTLLSLFLLTSQSSFHDKARIAMLLSLSTLGFALERSYPQPEEEELPPHDGDEADAGAPGD